MDKLPDKEGFALDARPPRWDFEAVQMCNKHFGKTVVRQVLEKYRRSHVTLDALREDILEYDIKSAPRPRDDPVYIAAFQSIRKEFTPQVPLIPLTIGAAANSSTVPKDKAPGLPWKNMGYKTKQAVFDDPTAMQEIRKDWILIGKGYRRPLPDCLAYARAQICKKDKNKVRATWGYPTGVFIEEARYVYPYLDFLKKRRDDYPLAYGIEMGNGGMGYIDDMFTRCGPGAKAVMLDWRKFDKMIPAWLIRDAFSIMFEAFRLDIVIDSEGKCWPVNPEITMARWKKMIDYFINTPIRLPDGTRYRKSAGVPSGSAFTNIIDSIINGIVTRYIMYNVTGAFPDYDMFMGDDSVVMLQRNVSLERLAALALEKFGFILNTEKSYVTSVRTNIQFLGYYNDYGYPIRSQDFLLASFMLPEHVNDPDPFLTAARAVGQMWSTFNGAAAVRWYELVHDIATKYSFSPHWFTEYMVQYPNRLKFLRLHGLEPTNFPDPVRFTALDAPMQPPPHPGRRRPTRRVTDIQDLYYQFVDDPPDVMDGPVDETPFAGEYEDDMNA